MFTALILNLLRAEEITEDDFEDSGSESDQSTKVITALQRESRRDRAVVRGFKVPNEYEVADYFEMYQQMVMEMHRDQLAREWLQQVVAQAASGKS